MFTRDKIGMAIAKQNMAYFVTFSAITGKIAFYSNSRAQCKMLDKNVEVNDYVTLSLLQYEWLTDETRDRTVTTAADMYKRVNWTKKGFTLDGKLVDFKNGKVVEI